MAFSIAQIDQTVIGDKRVVVLSCVADGASEAVETGLSAVDWANVTPKSMSTAGDNPKFSFSGSTVVASNITSGDEFYLTCYGH